MTVLDDFEDNKMWRIMGISVQEKMMEHKNINVDFG